MNTQISHFLKFGEMFDGSKIRDDLWIEWQHQAKSSTCCNICKVLDKCWFRDDIRPQQPLHPHCHCAKKAIKNPVSHKTATAECNIGKFTDFVWGEKHRWRGKWKFYEEMGYTVEDSLELAKELETQAVEKYCNGDYALGLLNDYGQRIKIFVELNGPTEKRKFGTGWMVRPYGHIENTTPLGSNKKNERV